MGENVLGLIVPAVKALRTGVGNPIGNPRRAGHRVASLVKWPPEFFLGYKDAINFSRLIKRMYPNTGETSEISVPIIDCFSDLELDLLLHYGLPPDHLAAAFEDWFCTSGELRKIAGKLLLTENCLPDAIADLHGRTDGDAGISPFAAANLVASKEDYRECLRRFNNSFPKHMPPGSTGWATKGFEMFSEVLDSNDWRDRMNPVPPRFLQNVNLTYTTLSISQTKLLAISMTENSALIFYESGDRTAQAIRVDDRGIFATRVPDLDGLACNADWMRLVAILMSESLKVTSTFPLVEMALVLMESIGALSDGGFYRHHGLGHTECRKLSRDRHKLSSALMLLSDLMRLARSIREASRMYAKCDTLDRGTGVPLPVLGVTFREARRQRPMPAYTYKFRNKAVQKIRDDMKAMELPSSAQQTKAIEQPFSSGSRDYRIESTSEPGVLESTSGQGALDAISGKLVDVMRREVGRIQEAYYTKLSRRREVCNISGSLWLDRIAKGKLLTSERAQELTYKRRLKTVPQELKSARETAFHLPLYDRTVVRPNMEDLTNIVYTRQQVGSDADLTSAVSVLVAAIMWANGQEASVVETMIKADQDGTCDLVQFGDGSRGIGAEVRKMFASKEEGELKITDLVSSVDRLGGPMDKAWVIREVLSLAVCHGVSCTSATEVMGGGYLKCVQTVRCTNRNRLNLIDADTYVSLEGVKVHRMSEIGRSREYEFRIVDDTVNSCFEVTLVVSTGTSEEELSRAMSPGRRNTNILVVQMEANNSISRNVGSSLIGTLRRVSVQ